MPRIYGVSVTRADSRFLVATLVADGSPGAMHAAGLIEKALDRGAMLVAVDPADRDAILAVLEDPPTYGLNELRGVLVRDADQRRRA